MKIFWKCVGDGGDDLLIANGFHPNAVHRIEVPAHTLDAVRYELGTSAGILPPSHQREGEWKWRVGLLDRFDFEKENAFRNQVFVARS